MLETFIDVKINGVQLLPPHQGRNAQSRKHIQQQVSEQAKTSVLRTGRCQRLTRDRQHGSQGGFAVSRCREKDRTALAAFQLQVNDGLLVVTAAIPVSTEAQIRICS